MSPGVRAFGIDVTESVHVRCAEGDSGPMRTLYVQEGERIRPILTDYPISRWRENVVYTIGVTKEVTNGYYNLEIKMTSFYSNSDKSESKTFEYCYDGEKYIPKEYLPKNKEPGSIAK